MADQNTQTFTDATFDTDVIQSDVPVLVDFWAEWCGPCRMMTPTVDAIATDYLGRLKVGKLNVDQNNGTAARYQVRGIPMLLLFKGGKVVDQRVGAMGKSEVQKMVEAHLAPQATAKEASVQDSKLAAVPAREKGSFNATKEASVQESTLLPKT